jgi:hypothetical protein
MTPSLLADLLHVLDDLGHVPGLLGVVVLGVHGLALVVHADHGHVQPLVPGNLPQRRQAVNRRAVAHHRLLVLGLQDPVLPAAGVDGPGGSVLPVQQHDVEVVGVGQGAQLVEFLLRVDALVGRRHLGHQLVGVPGNPLQGDPQHLVHLAVRLGGLEEADAAVVGMAHQTGEPLLSELALHLAADAPGAEGEPRHLHPGPAQGDEVGRGLALREERQASCGRQGPGRHSRLQELASAELGHFIPPRGLKPKW